MATKPLSLLDQIRAAAALPQEDRNRYKVDKAGQHVHANTRADAVAGKVDLRPNRDVPNGTEPMFVKEFGDVFVY
jgi:hypothetical protein